MLTLSSLDYGLGGGKGGGRWWLFSQLSTYTLYAFFWVIPRRLNFIRWRFRTLCSIFIDCIQPIRLWRRDRVFRNVGIQNSDTGKLPRRKHATFRTKWKIKIKTFNLHPIQWLEKSKWLTQVHC